MKKLRLYWWVMIGMLGNVNLMASNIFVTNTNNSGAGSFQNAVNLAFNDPSPNTIRFDLSPGSVIYPTGQIWIQGNGDVIDGQITGTQERIIFDGMNFNLGDAWALIVNCSSCTVQNVEMRNFSYTAIGVWEVSDILLRDNVLYGNKTGIQVDGGSQNVSVESNIIGVNANMVNTQSEDAEDYGIWVGEGYNVTITGNVVSGLGETNEENIGIVLDSEDIGSGITIANNLIGVDESGLNALPNHYGVWIGAAKSNVEVYNNILSGNKDSGLVISGSDVDAYDNNIGYDITGQNIFPSDTTGIWVGDNASNVSIYRNQIAGNNISTWGIYCQNITNVSLGTNNENDKNEITSCNVGVGLLYNGEIDFGVNKLSCNNFPIWFQAQDGMPAPEIMNTTSGTIQGTAPANTTIDVYTHNDSGCNNVLCQGKEYIGSTQANSLGNWSLSGLNLQPNTEVTAIATSGSSLSNYASCEAVSGAPAFCEGSCYSMSCLLLPFATTQGQTDGSCSYGNMNDYGCQNNLLGPEYVYHFYMDTEQDVYFDLDSPSELYVMVMDECSPSATCLDYFSSNEGGKVITIPEGGAYLVIDGADLQGDSYTLSYNCNIQPPQASDCAPDPAFTDFYQNDAEVLAAVQMINDPIYASTVEIPTDLFDFYYDRLNAIFNATDIPERDTVVECLNIHNQGGSGFTNHILVNVLPNTDWAEELINGIFPTSNTQINSLFNQYNLSLPYHSIGTDNWNLDIVAEHHLNTQALADVFATITGVMSASPNYITIFCLFDGISTIRYNNYVDINFFMSIPCADGVNWMFRVYDDCSVQFLQRTGNDIEPIVCDDSYLCATEPLCLPWLQDTLNHYTPPSTTPYCIPNDPLFSYGLSKYAYNGYEVFGIGWVGFDTWETRFYNCEGDYLGINYNYDGMGGISEPSSLPAYEYEATLWDCEDELPLCNNCPTDPSEVLCLDWIQNYIQNIDCQASCPEYIQMYDYQGSQVIQIYTGGGCYPLLDFPRFDVYTCDGEFLFEYSGQQPSLSNPVDIWDCSQPAPDCGNSGNTDCACTNYTTGNICDNFDSYTTGQYLGSQSPCWEPWDGINGGSVDVIVNGTEGVNGTAAIEINDSEDMVLKLGGRTSGRYNLSFKMKLKPNRAGHYNLLHAFTPNNTSTDDLNGAGVFFLPNGEGYLLYQGNDYQFNYGSAANWINVHNIIDLDNDLVTLYVNGVEIDTWPFSYDTNSGSNPVVLEGVDFFSFDSQNYIYEFFVDDVSLVDMDDLPSCQVNDGDLLCTDWLNQKIIDYAGIQFTPPCYSCLVVPAVGNFLQVNKYDNDIIELSYGYCTTGVNEYYDCQGNLLYTCSFGFESNDQLVSNCNPDFLDNASSVNKWDCTQDELPECGPPTACNSTSNEILCLPWVQNYLNTNYTCDAGQCGSINLYTSPAGECVVDFVGEQPCLLTVCESHEVFDLEGNLMASYVSCGLEPFGYTNWQPIWSCGESLPGCNDYITYTLYPELPQTPICTGESVCIPITVENFSNITGSSFGLQWNPDILSYEGVWNLNWMEVTGLGYGSFDLSNTGNGELMVDWETVPCNQAQPGSGITLDDCNGSCRPTLFEVCFNVVGGDGQNTSFNLLPGSYAYKDLGVCVESPIGIQVGTLEACGEGVTCATEAMEILCQPWVDGYITHTLNYSDCGSGDFEVQLFSDGTSHIIDFIRYDYWNACPSDIHALYNCSGVLLDSVYVPAQLGCFQDGDLSLLEGLELVDEWNCTESTLPNCTSPWTPQACASGNTHFINVIYEDLESEIDGQPLQEGDWLGLFYEQDDGTLVCMDQAQFSDPLQENGFQLRACEESSPGADDGFALDEPFQFKVFKDGVEYEAGTLSVAFWGEGEIIPPVFPDATSRFIGDGRQSAIRSIRDFPDIEDPSCDTPIPISCGQSHSGNNTDGTDNALSYNCFTNVVDGPEVIYTFTIDQTEDVLITLDGLSDDLELLLLDECDRDHCIAVSERTGASAETILYEDLEPGDYVIVVEGYIGFQSDYTLSLDCGDFPQGDFNCTPEEIGCNETISATTADGCSDVSFYNCSDSYMPGREKVYRIRFDQPENVRITLTPQGGDLELFLLDALDPNRCIYSSTESGDEIERILLDDNEIIPNRDYYIVVDEFNTNNGVDFQLQVQCVPDGPPCPWCPPPPGFCDNAEAITCGTTINGHTQNGDARVDKWGDCPSFNVGPELIYVFDNPVTQDVQVTLSGFTENLNFYILRDQCAVSACYEGWAGNKSGLITESILITPMPAGLYYIVVDSYDAASAFALEVKCQETDNCFELDVPEGISYISSNRRPGDPTIENVLPQGQFQGTSLLLSDEWANVYDPNFPTPGAPNRIMNWTVTDGYRIDLSEAVTVEFCGEEADPEATRNVIVQNAAGEPHQNFIAFPFQEAMTVEEAFAGSPTEGLSSIEYRYPSIENQPSESYIIPLQLGTNFTMEPGVGYILKVAQDGAFSFRNNEEAYPFIPNGCTYFRTPLRSTPERAFIRVPQPSVSGLMQTGDELGLFNEAGLLCGSGKYLGSQLIIVLLGDDPATEVQEGFTAGEMIYARTWSEETGKTKEVGLQFSESEPVYASSHQYWLEGLSSRVNTDHIPAMNWQLYPNPAGERLYLEYQLPTAQEVSIRLIGANGQVHARYKWYVDGGVDQRSIDLKQLPDGIYFVQLSTVGTTESRKIVVQH